MKDNTMTGPINIKRWLEKSFSFGNVSLQEVEKAFIKVIGSQGFKIRKRSESKDAVSIEAMYGLKKLAALTLFIPYIGVHLPWGKRVLLTASISSGKFTKFDISITPWMEFLDSEEIGGITQPFPEKVSDEYFAARKMYFISALK